MSETTPKAVFLSYASQDAEAAKRIADALRAAGVEVWFDQSELRGGDSWDAKIRKQIKECALFVPVITPNTNSRPEGYFRLEWKLAVDRSHLMADDEPFLFPLVIGDVVDATARVPDKFREVQWTRLRLDETPAELAKRVAKLLAGGLEMEPGRPRPGMESRGGVATPPGRANQRPAWMRFAWAGVGIVFALVYAVRPLFQPAHPSEPKPAAIAPVPPTAPAANTPGARPASAADQLVERANAILGGPARTREQIDTANGLLEQAIALEPTNAAAWTAAARADLMLVYPYGYDRSEERRQRAMSRADRAINLAPDSLATRVVRTSVMAHASGNPALTREAEQTFRQMIQARPDDLNLKLQLAEVLREENRFKDAAALFEQIGEFELAGWSWFQAGNYPAAYGPVQRAVAEHRTTTALQLKSSIEANWFEDLARAQATIDQLQPSELQSEIVVGSAVTIAFERRDSERMLDILNGLSHDFLDSHSFVGPRQYLTGWAHRIAGRTERAKIEWRKALAVLQTARTAAPDRVELIELEAEIHGLLGETREAERLLAEAERVANEAPGTVTRGNFAAYLALGRPEPVLTWLDAYLRPRTGAQWISLHAAVRFSPVWDSVRGDPRFEKILRDTMPPGGKPFDEPKPATAPAPVDEKSVAVLAFANLSDDKANEYFSDGISEELLNVLAKIPGLKVSARTSAFYFKGKEVPIPEIARQLGVAYVIEGSVRKQGDKVRITAQLIKAADGFHVWSETFTRDLKDIFAVQDEIAGLIAKNLSLKMGMTAARPTIDVEAYQEYLAGRALFAKASNDDLRAAVGHFEKAVAIEPKFTAAWVQLASVHTQLGRWGGTPTPQAWAAARTAIDHAVALEPDSPDVLLALGWILRTGEWDWRGAERAYRRALELRPDHPDTLSAAAVLLFNLGRKDEALRLGRQAVQLDPLNAATQIDLSLVFYFSQDWAEQEKLARRAIQLAPTGVSYHGLLAFSLAEQRRFAEAEAEARVDTDEVGRFYALGIIAALQGQGEAARGYRRQLEELSRVRGDTADLQLGIADIAALLGDKDQAFAALEKSESARDPSVAWFRNDFYLRLLHTDPRWDALLRRVGLADDQLK